MDPEQKLNSLKSSLQADWEKNSSLVVRLILLRNFFHSIHQLINECLASREENPPGLDELHQDLSTLADRLICSSQQEIQKSLSQTQQPWELIRGRDPLSPGQAQWPDLPLPLIQPGREWEKLIYTLGLTQGWTPEREDIRIERPAQLEKWIQESRTPPELGSLTQFRVILALEKNPLEPGSWWLHSLRPPS